MNKLLKKRADLDWSIGHAILDVYLDNEWREESRVGVGTRLQNFFYYLQGRSYGRFNPSDLQLVRTVRVVTEWKDLAQQDSCVRDIIVDRNNWRKAELAIPFLQYVDASNIHAVLMAIDDSPTKEVKEKVRKAISQISMWFKPLATT